MIQISYKDRSFIVEQMTEEDKEILKAEKPEMYDKHFKYSKELKELAPLGKSNGTTAIVKKWHEEAWEEFKRVNPQLMSQYKDNKKNNREKTRFPIEVILYNILVEGRYTGQW